MTGVRGAYASVLVGLMAVLGVDMSMAVGAAAARQHCGGHLRDGQWTEVPKPAKAADKTAQDDVDPCHLSATDGRDIFSSSDGGGHWSRGQLPPHGSITSLVTQGLGPGVVVAGSSADPAAGVPDQVLLSATAGDNFTAVSGTSGDVVLAAATATGSSISGSPNATVYLLIANSQGSNNGSTLYVSTDSGQTFMPLPQSTGMNATRMAVDPTDGQNIWLNSTGTATTAPLWRSTDGGETFSAVTVPNVANVTDIALSTRNDGVVEAYATTPKGVFASDSDGVHWWQVAAMSAGVSAVEVEHANDRVLAVVSAGKALRAAIPAPFRQMTAGWSSSCRGVGLAVDGNDFADFLLTCANGSSYRYRDASAPTVPPAYFPVPPSSNPAYSTAAALPMVSVQTWPLPGAATGGGFAQTSGTIAFDGHVLYYLGVGDPETAGSLSGGPSPSPVLRILRIVAATGAALPPIDLHLGLPPKNIRTDLSFDARRNLLLILTGRGVNTNTSPFHTNLQVLGYNVSTGSLSRQFFLPPGGGMAPFVEPDPSTGGYLSSDTNLTAITKQNSRFQTIGGCSNSEVAAEVGASLTPAGDGGGAYVEMEDDQTIVRIDSQCRTTQRYVHRLVSEAFSEDDALACDGQDFPLPAIWLRDAVVGTVTAWLTPGAFCPLPSRLRVVAPTTMRVGQSAVLCAKLGSAALPALAHQPVAIAVDGQQLGYVATGSDGLACVPYRATQRGLRTVVARYFGSHKTPQLLPSLATADIRVGAQTSAQLSAPTLLVTAGGLAAATSGPGPGAPPGTGQPVPNAQGQAQAQTNAQSQSQANPQAGLAAQQDEDVQLAYATDDGRSRRVPGAATLLMGAGALTGAAAAFARRSQRREAWQRWR